MSKRKGEGGDDDQAHILSIRERLRFSPSPPPVTVFNPVGEPLPKRARRHERRREEALQRQLQREQDEQESTTMTLRSSSGGRSRSSTIGSSAILHHKTLAAAAATISSKLSHPRTPLKEKNILFGINTPHVKGREEVRIPTTSKAAPSSDLPPIVEVEASNAAAKTRRGRAANNAQPVEVATAVKSKVVSPVPAKSAPQTNSAADIINKAASTRKRSLESESNSEVTPANKKIDAPSTSTVAEQSTTCSDTAQTYPPNKSTDPLNSEAPKPDHKKKRAVAAVSKTPKVSKRRASSKDGDGNAASKSSSTVLASVTERSASGSSRKVHSREDLQDTVATSELSDGNQQAPTVKTVVFSDLLVEVDLTSQPQRDGISTSDRQTEAHHKADGLPQAGGQSSAKKLEEAKNVDENTDEQTAEVCKVNTEPETVQNEQDMQDAASKIVAEATLPATFEMDNDDNPIPDAIAPSSPGRFAQWDKTTAPFAKTDEDEDDLIYVSTEQYSQHHEELQAKGEKGRLSPGTLGRKVISLSAPVRGKAEAKEGSTRPKPMHSTPPKGKSKQADTLAALAPSPRTIQLERLYGLRDDDDDDDDDNLIVNAKIVKPLAKEAVAKPINTIKRVPRVEAQKQTSVESKTTTKEMPNTKAKEKRSSTSWRRKASKADNIIKPDANDMFGFAATGRLLDLKEKSRKKVGSLSQPVKRGTQGEASLTDEEGQFTLHARTSPIRVLSPPPKEKSPPLPVSLEQLRSSDVSVQASQRKAAISLDLTDLDPDLEEVPKQSSQKAEQSTAKPGKDDEEDEPEESGPMTVEQVLALSLLGGDGVTSARSDPSASKKATSKGMKRKAKGGHYDRQLSLHTSSIEDQLPKPKAKQAKSLLFLDDSVESTQHTVVGSKAKKKPRLSAAATSSTSAAVTQEDMDDFDILPGSKPSTGRDSSKKANTKTPRAAKSRLSKVKEDVTASSPSNANNSKPRPRPRPIARGSSSRSSEYGEPKKRGPLQDSRAINLADEDSGGEEDMYTLPSKSPAEKKKAKRAVAKSQGDQDKARLKKPGLQDPILDEFNSLKDYKLPVEIV